jgi:hypothetical protein
LAKSWNSVQIRRAVGDPVQPFGGAASFTGNRDEILIAELMRRGLTNQEISDLLTDVRPATAANYEERLRSFIGGLRVSGEVSVMGIFETALSAYERAGATAESAVGLLFGRAAMGYCPAAVEPRALELLAKGVFVITPLGYLQRCSRSPQTVTKLESMSFSPEKLETARVNAIAAIRKNIQNPNKSLPPGIPPPRPTVIRSPAHP